MLKIHYSFRRENGLSNNLGGKSNGIIFLQQFHAQKN